MYIRTTHNSRMVFRLELGELLFRDPEDADKTNMLKNPGLGPI